MSFILQSIENPDLEIETTQRFWTSLLTEAATLGRSLDDDTQYISDYMTNDGEVMSALDVRNLLKIIQGHKEELEQNSQIQELDEEFIEFLSAAAAIKVT